MRVRAFARWLLVVVTLAMLVGSLSATTALAATTGTISGTVFEPGGAPAAGVTVRACHLFFVCAPQDVTDAAGQFSITADEDAGAGYLVQATRPLGASYFSTGATGVLVVGAQTTTIDFTMDAGGIAEGVVTGGPTNEPVAGASVTAIESATTTAPDGSYSFLTPSGPKSISVQPATGSFFLPASVPIVVPTGGTVHQDVNLALGGRIDGTILNAAGNPIPLITFPGFPSFGPSAIVCNGPIAPPLPFCALPAGGLFQVQPDGSFQYGPLAPGTYQIAGADTTNFFATVLGDATAVTVTAGATTTCALRAPGPASCSGGNDNDGIPASVEDLAPNGGDGNLDGEQDSQQGHVASFPNAVDGGYLTLATDDDEMSLVNVAAIDPADLPAEQQPPDGANLPVGALTFEVHGSFDNGDTVTVRLILPPGTEADAYFKLDDDWSPFPGAAIDENEIVLTFTDNGPGDQDPAPGVIRDPAAVFDLREFSGFFSPVDNLPVTNVVKAGQAVPLKFSLGGDQGLDVLGVSSPTSRRIDCTSGAELDPIETTVSAPASGLQYDASRDQYSYVWKTSSSWSDTCRELVLELDDGSTHTTIFKIR